MFSLNKKVQFYLNSYLQMNWQTGKYRAKRRTFVIRLLLSVRRDTC